jgi:hypothetical protein
LAELCHLSFLTNFCSFSIFWQNCAISHF